MRGSVKWWHGIEEYDPAAHSDSLCHTDFFSRTLILSVLFNLKISAFADHLVMATADESATTVETLLAKLSLGSTRQEARDGSVSSRGYYRSPAVRSGRVCFISEDDVFVLDSIDGGSCRRLTTCGHCESVAVSLDCSIVAYSSCVLGNSEVFVVPFLGGAARQVTFSGDGSTRVLDWDSSDPSKLYIRQSRCSAVRPSTAEVNALDVVEGTVVPVGFGESSTYQTSSTMSIIGRHTREPHLGHWKHYKGGSGGQLWLLARERAAPFVRVCREYNIASPVLHENAGKIYFIADPVDDMPGNVYAFDAKSYIATGEETVEQVSFHTHFYARNLNICNVSNQLVYQCGGDIYFLDLSKTGGYHAHTRPSIIDFAWNSFSQTSTVRSVDEPLEFVGNVAVHPAGHLIVAEVRGKLFEMPLFEGPAVQLGAFSGVRYCETTYLRCGRIATVSRGNQFGKGALRIEIFTSPTNYQKAENEYDPETLPPYVNDEDKGQGGRQGHEAKPSAPPPPFGFEAHSSVRLKFDNRGHKLSKQLDESDPLGRPDVLLASPNKDVIAIVNHRQELLIASYPSHKTKYMKKEFEGTLKRLDVGKYEDGLHSVVFSPCGTYLAYSFKTTLFSSVIRVANIKTGRVNNVTESSYFFDTCPTFDPAGRYLYFLSNRTYCPVEDQVWGGGISFPSSDTPMMVTLQKDTPTPFLRRPERPSGGDESSDEGPYDDEESESDEGASSGRESDSSWVDEGASSSSEKEDEMCDFGEPQPTIDFNGIGSRVICIPGIASSGHTIRGLKCFGSNKLTYIRELIVDGANKESCLYDSEDEDERNGKGTFVCYNIDKRKETTIKGDNIVGASFSFDTSTLLLRSLEDEESMFSAFLAHKLLGKSDDGGGGSDESEDEDDKDSGRRTAGPINIEDRVRVEISPKEEWRQMLAEAWQVTKDEVFGRKDFPWDRIFHVYEPLLERINCRSEFSDVLDELLAELQSSHAYTNDGDYDAFGMISENTDQGFLGADVSMTPTGAVIKKIYKGDPWSLSNAGSLCRPGLNLRTGDTIVSVNHRHLSPTYTLAYALRGMAGKEVYLNVVRPVPEGHQKKGKGNKKKIVGSGKAWVEEKPNTEGSGKKKKQGSKMHKGKQKGDGSGGRGSKGGGKSQQSGRGGKDQGGRKQGGESDAEPTAVRILRVRCITKEIDEFIRYKDDVTRATNFVHQKSKNECGYVHLPNMDTMAFIQWSRSFRVESQRNALIVDIRGNGGGNISHLLLEKLNARCLGVEVPRFGQAEPYPIHIPSRKQVLVLLADESSCSDADVLAHAFQIYGLGPVVGARTWGGVVGISQTSDLVDGTEISHPSCGYYAAGRGFGIENHGVVPDLEVEISPTDHALGKDPQLDKAIEIVLGSLKTGSKTTTFTGLLEEMKGAAP